MSDATFAIGEVADMLGLSPHTIRAWERRHLFASPMRTAAGQRRYTADDVEVLRQIKHGRHALGFSMRVATMAAQGLLVPEPRETNGPDPAPPVDAESEAEAADPLRRIVDLVSDVVIVVDAGGRILYANTAFVRFCDALPGQVQGQPLADFVDPFDRAKAVQAYQPHLRSRRGWEFGLRTKRRRALFAFDCWPLPAGDGQVLALVGRQLDAWPAGEPDGLAAVHPGPVLERADGPRRDAYPPVAALLDGVADPARTLELIRPWLDATPLGVVLIATDPELTVQVANEAFRRLAARQAPDVEGRPWRELAPPADAGRLAAAAREVAGTAQQRRVTGFRPPWEDRSSPPPTVWDVELCPVTEVGGAVSHLLLTVRDATADVAAARQLEALAGCAPELRRAADAGEVLTIAARHARALLPDADTLVASTRGTDGSGLDIVVADGVWGDGDADGEADLDLRLALVRDVVRTGASMEIERTGTAEAVRIVPLRAPAGAAQPGQVLGAVAFSRPGARPFSAADRLLVDEFAGRVGLAMGQAELLSGAAPAGRP
jgi:PAS domain S-box-containing protein